MAYVPELLERMRRETEEGLRERLKEALAVCQLVDDFHRLTAGEFKLRYGVVTFGEGWDKLCAMAREVLAAEGGVR